MNLGVKLCVRVKLLIALHELSACLLVQGTLWKGHYQQALYNLEDMGKGPACLAPVLFESVHTNLARLGSHIRVEDLCQEVPFRRLGREI